MANNHNPSLATQYDSFAKTFIEGTDHYNDYSRKVYYDMLDFDMRGKELLDVGCGDGYDLEIFHKRGAHINGVDASNEMVQRARNRLQFTNANLGCIKQGVMEDLPYTDSLFDIVVSKYVIQTSPDVPKVLTEMDRVLVPGGILAYLAVHPMRQFLEKKKHPKDYFVQEVVDSVFHEGRVCAREPTHTLNEYLSPWFFQNYKLLHFEEHADFPSAENVEGDTYPCFFVVKAQKTK